jgi:hypothetical protein
MAFRPSEASWEQKQEWRLFGSPDLDIRNHITNPVGRERHGTLHDLVLPSREKSQFEARGHRAKTPFGPNRAAEKRPILASPPSYQTPSRPIIAKPPLSSPPSYRPPPIPTANDPLLISPPTFNSPGQKVRFATPSQSFNKANYTAFPQGSEPLPIIAAKPADSILNKPVTAPAPLFSNRHKRNISNMSTATVQIGLRMSTVRASPEIQENINRSFTYPPTTDRTKVNEPKEPLPRTQRSLDRPRTLGPPIELRRDPRESTPHEILFRLNSNEELSPEPISTPRTWPKPLEDLVSPSRTMSSWRKVRDKRMKSLPPVPVTPSSMQPTSGLRASFPEPRSPASQDVIDPEQERTALSLALKEDEQWPLKGVSMMLPNKSYIPNENRSWI